MPGNDTSFRLFKGSKNTVEFQVVNNDRKPYYLADYQIIITISDPENDQVLYQQPLIIEDPYLGAANLILSQPDTDDWPLGFLRYIVTLQGSDQNQHILYVDQDEGAEGFFELLEGPNLGPMPSLSSVNFTPGQNGYWYSSIFPGNAQENRHDFGEITMAFYMTNFTGQVFIQGCIEDPVPTDSNGWFAINTRESTANLIGPPSIKVSNFTGILPVTFEASLRWVRALYLPDIANHGSFNKILFRT